VTSRWTVQDSADLYHIPKWGAPYFAVNERGHMVCTPWGPEKGAIDLKELIDDLCRRDITPPILIRINDLLAARIEHLASNFALAMKEYGYKGDYLPAMPIKVNQQRHVVEELLRHGRKFRLGLEAGSKPELLVAIALLEDEDSLLICNGYKDSEFIETALLAQSLGRYPIIVMDRFAELQLTLDISKKLGMKPHLGMRVKLSSKGAGKWEESSGDSSKFGLSVPELVSAVEKLQALDMLDCLELIHFHIGSQITSIRSVKEAIREASRVYIGLRELGANNLKFMDVGGGLAVDYDGSQTNFPSSKNYSVQEYANDVVGSIMDACETAGQPHPHIITESGRALVAHHAILVFNVLGVHERKVGADTVMEKPRDDEPDIVRSMFDAYSEVSKKNYQEAFNDAVLLKDESATLFSHGVIDLKTRARVEDLYWATLARVQRTTKQLDYVPDDFVGLDKRLSDTFFCNFSVFQSLPDSWAVHQLFPIVPLHRHDEEPTRDGIIADLTCDSDGKVDEFIDLRDVKDTLRLHTPNNQPYYLGAFLVGAYQETLGDLHNLFGDTNAVHVTLAEGGGYELEYVVKGDRVKDVLTYVEFEPNMLVNKVRQAAERAVRTGRFTFEQSAQFMRRYEEGLTGYTYLEDVD
jgi:arginine decarboxylase